MSAPAQPTGPAVRKVLPMIVVVDIILLGGGVFAYVRTGNLFALGIPVVLASVIVFMLLMRAIASDKAGLKPTSIVE